MCQLCLTFYPTDKTIPNISAFGWGAPLVWGVWNGTQVSHMQDQHRSCCVVAAACPLPRAIFIHDIFFTAYQAKQYSRNLAFLHLVVLVPLMPPIQYCDFKMPNQTSALAWCQGSNPGPRACGTSGKSQIFST